VSTRSAGNVSKDTRAPAPRGQKSAAKSSTEQHKVAKSTDSRKEDRKRISAELHDITAEPRHSLDDNAEEAVDYLAHVPRRKHPVRLLKLHGTPCREVENRRM